MFVLLDVHTAPEHRFSRRPSKEHPVDVCARGAQLCCGRQSLATSTRDPYGKMDLRQLFFQFHNRRRKDKNHQMLGIKIENSESPSKTLDSRLGENSEILVLI